MKIGKSAKEINDCEANFADIGSIPSRRPSVPQLRRVIFHRSLSIRSYLIEIIEISTYIPFRDAILLSFLRDTATDGRDQNRSSRSARTPVPRDAKVTANSRNLYRPTDFRNRSKIRIDFSRGRFKPRNAAVETPKITSPSKAEQNTRLFDDFNVPE